MQLPEIKRLVETYKVEELQLAEEALMNEVPLVITVEGKDEGEQLTHILAAIDILSEMQKNGLDARTALRNYTQRVRNSIN
jgi:hypothetical protein